MADEELLPDHEMMRLIPELRKHASQRKCRLYACACCRRIWSLIPDDACRAAVVAAEWFADKVVGSATLGDANTRAKASHRGYHRRATEPAYYATEACYRVTLSNIDDALKACESVCQAQSYALAGLGDSGEVDAERARDASYHEFTLQTHLLRELLGNLSRPVEPEPGWLTSTVVVLARQMDESRDFSAMPILADALQDAGCENADVLDHCRGPQQSHVRGCWLVGCLLGKE